MWRTPVFYRLFFPVVGVFALGFSVVDFDSGSDLTSTVESLTLGLVFTLGPFRPCVRLGGDAAFARGVVFPDDPVAGAGGGASMRPDARANDIRAGPV